MKRIITIAALFLIGCEKQKTECYDCRIWGGPLNYEGRVTQCVEDSTQLSHDYKDPQGNELNTQCWKR